MIGLGIGPEYPTRPLDGQWGWVEPEVRNLMESMGVVDSVSVFYMQSTAYQISGHNLGLYTNNCVVSVKNALGLALGSMTLKTRIPFWYPFLLNSTATQRWNLSDTTTFAGTFNGGTSNTGAGFQPNGVNGYFNTFCSMLNSGLVDNSIALHIYSKTAADGVYTDIGAIDNTAGGQFDIQMYTYFNGNFITKFGTSGVADATAAANSVGLFSMIRDSNTSYKQYRNATLLATPSRTKSGDYNMEYIYIGALNNDSTGAAQFSPRLFTHAMFSNAFTGTELTNVYNALNTFDTALNRF